MDNHWRILLKEQIFHPQKGFWPKKWVNILNCKISDPLTGPAICTLHLCKSSLTSEQFNIQAGGFVLVS